MDRAIFGLLSAAFLSYSNRFVSRLVVYAPWRFLRSPSAGWSLRCGTHKRVVTGRGLLALIWPLIRIKPTVRICDLRALAL